MPMWDRIKRVGRAAVNGPREFIKPSIATVDSRIETQLESALSGNLVGDDIRPLLEDVSAFRTLARNGNEVARLQYDTAMESLRNDFGVVLNFSKRGKVTVSAVDRSVKNVPLDKAASSGFLNGTPLGGIKARNELAAGEGDAPEPGEKPKLTARSSAFMKRNWGKYTDYYRDHKTGGIAFSAAKVGIGAALVWNGAKKLLNRNDGNEFDMEMEEGGVTKPTAAGKLWAGVQTLVGAGLVVLGAYTGKLAIQGKGGNARGI